jgi:hypothetical protein
MEEWHEFCTKEDAFTYVKREWCSVEDATKLWPEKDSTDRLTVSEIEECMESIQDTIECFNDNIATLMEAIKRLTQHDESVSLLQYIPSETRK